MQNITDDLRRASMCAKSHLAQIAAIRLVLIEKQDSVDKESAACIQDPSIIRGYNDDLTKETQELFKPFESYFTECPPKHLSGHFFNKALVLLADAVLHKYLKEIYTIMKPVKGWSGDLPNSLSGQIRVLFIGNPNGNVASLLPYNSLFPKFDHVKFLDQLRHVIIHNIGEVDKSFYKECGVDPDSGNSISLRAQLWGLPSGWTDPFFADTLDEFKKYFKLGDQIHLPIDRIFGLLKEAFLFINDICDLCIKEVT